MPVSALLRSTSLSSLNSRVRAAMAGCRCWRNRAVLDHLLEHTAGRAALLREMEARFSQQPCDLFEHRSQRHPHALRFEATVADSALVPSRLPAVCNCSDAIPEDIFRVAFAPAYTTDTA